MKEKYDALSAQVKSEQTTYARKVSAYKANEAAYNAAVSRANKKGGASEAEYDRLEAQKAALLKEYADIKSFQDDMNADIDRLNALANSMNKLIAQLNLNVDQYNQVGAEVGEFEEGSGGIETIDIYEYSNRTQLVRVLAHEMGHALGMSHVNDEEAIMYKVNSGTLLKATADDLAELDNACHI
jgi:chromosome segregation ATPase